jgi:hypothetical protein
MKRLTLLVALVLACSSRPLGGHAWDSGVSGDGGSRAAGGVIGTGGSPSTSGGSTATTDLDSCSSNADCLSSCIWITAPTTSNECTANYCCGMTWLSQKRCDANRAAWATYCPNQAPTSFPCPCVQLCQNETFSCIGGQCSTSCTPVVASGGASGNGGHSGMGEANSGTGGSSAIGIPAGAFLSVSVSDELFTPANACAVRTDGTLACWGDDTFGKATPTAGTFTSVSVGSSAACGLKTEGTIVCWGDNTHGEATAPAGTFTSVSAGDNYACGLRADGTITCWGDNTYGKATPPTSVFKSISAGLWTGCGVRDNGTVSCWGDNGQGQASPPSGNFLSVSVGDTAACGVQTDGTVACWGMAYGYNPYETTPPAGTFASISVSATAACGVRTDGTVACWGGAGPSDTPPAGTFSSVSAGSPYACAVTSANRSIACWYLPQNWGGLMF